jgi:hypothetical protein
LGFLPPNPLIARDPIRVHASSLPQAGAFWFFSYKAYAKLENGNQGLGAFTQA